MTGYNGRKAKSWRIRRHLAGGGSTLADAEPLRPILHELHSRMSWTAVARLCGTTSHRHVRMIADGEVRRVSHDMAARVHAAAGQVLGEGKQHVSALGAQRRLRALIALGYSIARLSQETGYSETPMKALVRGDVDVIHADTHRRVADVYERLCMTHPPARTKYERGAVTRSKRRAALGGWAPPLAWDDIDDPDETPSGIGYLDPGATRAEQIAEAVVLGWDARETCQRLDVTWDTLERWCARNGMHADWRTLVERMPYRPTNQWDVA